MKKCELIAHLAFLGDDDEVFLMDQVDIETLYSNIRIEKFQAILPEHEPAFAVLRPLPDTQP